MEWLTKAIPERHGQRAKRFPGRSLFFGGLLLVGVLSGVQIYCRADAETLPVLARLLTTGAVEHSFIGVMAALGDTLLLPFLLLMTAFLSGLSPCGVVCACLIPLFYGMSVGLTEANLYAGGWGGVVLSLLIVLPRALLMLLALLEVCGECARMSQLFLAQLRPASAHCGGLQLEFKAYCLRFAVACFWMLAAGIWDVLARLLCGAWL